MNSFKSRVNTELGNPTFDVSFDVVHKRCVRRDRWKKAIVTISSFCVVTALLTFFSNIVTIVSDSGTPDGFSVTVFAADETDSGKALTNAQSLVSYQSYGVVKKADVSKYNEKGQPDYDNGKIKLIRYTFDYMPIVFEIQQIDREIESFDISCGENGVLSTGSVNLRNDYSGIAYNHIQQVLWYPSFTELNRAVSNAVGNEKNIFSDYNYKDDKKISKTIDTLLQTKEDYNRFFADTVSLTVHYKNGESENCRAGINLDKNGFYLVKYI